MRKFHVRLTLVFIVLIGLSVLAAGIFTAKLLENAHIDALQDNLQAEIHLIMSTVDWRKSGTPAELQAYFMKQSQFLKESAGARVTFIAHDGTVYGDSDHDSATMDNHLTRPEVQEALRTGSGKSVRYSNTLKQNMLYVAVRVPDSQYSIGFIRLAMSLKVVEASVDKLWIFLIGGLLVLFAVAGVISYRLAYNLTRPIEIITKIAQRITLREYKARVPFRRGDEIGMLGQAINSMADSLQNQLARISEEEARLSTVLDNMISGVIMIDVEGGFVLLNRAAEELLGFAATELVGKRFDAAKQQPEFSGLIREALDGRMLVRGEILFHYPEERIVEVNVSPLRGADDEFTGLLAVLHNITAMRRLERMRSEFVANVSHELKTPIAAVKGFAETLLTGALEDKETARSFLQIIFDESERLNRLIGDILELSKIESRQIPLQFSPVELEPFVRRTLQMMEAEAAKKRIELKLQVEQGLFIEADEDRLRQIVTNLVSNGIAYTPEGGKVAVTVEAVSVTGETESERVRFTVADTGIGIPKKDLPRIFERFYRVDKARSRSSGGTGLGLSIVKHLVELHHGIMTVESEVGFGSRFIFELPLIQSL